MNGEGERLQWVRMFGMGSSAAKDTWVLFKSSFLDLALFFLVVLIARFGGKNFWTLVHVFNFLFIGFHASSTSERHVRYVCDVWCTTS